MIFMQNFQNNFIQSYPYKVFFEGFESDTYRLQSAGWQIACDGQYSAALNTECLRLLIKHPHLKVTGISEAQAIQRYLFSDFDSERFYKSLVFKIIAIHPQIQVYGVQSTAQITSAFHEIDATPWIMNRVDLNSCPIFRTLIKPQNEIIIDQADVNILLEEILKKQSPIQRDIREKNRKQEAREAIAENKVLHAQITSLVA